MEDPADENIDDWSSASLADLAAEYGRIEATLQKLAREVEFSLDAALKKSGIKIHAVSSRVKDLDSVLEKVDRKKYRAPLTEMQDLVGARIVCLFMPDLLNIRKMLHDTFDVLQEEDKINTEDVASFGYMSVHYVCRLGDWHSGPHYEGILQQVFEIQARTIAMDAWANISHHLAYKGEASIPQALRKDFHALSGLFYVADQHFEMFVKAAKEVEIDARREIAESDTNFHGVLLNAETLLAYVRARHPGRRKSDKAEASSFAEELLRAGYSTIEQLHDVVLKGQEQAALEDSRREQPYSDLGMIRVAVTAADENYRSLLYSKFGIDDV
ncbi:GTP pyrophosphokinase family protein [Krasilnikovia sp. MM14-A1259]|uniref:GTP pyrophosphokinase n=1 Tax=Krasilnikovia sp. MM14-A1259 TaxID=3373539 RepID=UPI00382BED5B